MVFLHVVFKHVLWIERSSVQEGLHECSVLAVFSLIGSLVVVIAHEVVHVLLNGFDGLVQLLPERYFVKSFLQSLVDVFSRAVGLRMADLDSGMLNAGKMKEEFAGMGRSTRFPGQLRYGATPCAGRGSECDFIEIHPGEAKVGMRVDCGLLVELADS